MLRYTMFVLIVGLASISYAQEPGKLKIRKLDPPDTSTERALVEKELVNIAAAHMFIIKRQHDELKQLLQDKPAIVNLELPFNIKPTSSNDDYIPNMIVRACVMNDTKSIKILLEHRADPNAEYNVNSPIIHVCVKHGNMEAVKLLLTAGAKPMPTPAIRVYKSNLDKGAPAGVVRPIEAELYDDIPSMHLAEYAKHCGHTELHQFLKDYLSKSKSK